MRKGLPWPLRAMSQSCRGRGPWRHPLSDPWQPGVGGDISADNHRAESFIFRMKPGRSYK